MCGRFDTSHLSVILEPEEWSRWLDPTHDAAGLMATVRPERFDIADAVGGSDLNMFGQA